MKAEVLAAQLESSGIVLAVEQGKLRVNAPRGSLSEQMRQAIAEARDDLIALLEARSLQSAPLQRFAGGAGAARAAHQMTAPR